MKKADFYFFDEPSSYLDVEQRLKVAKEIRLKARDAHILVVEHDLAVLDYLSDHVHILYGFPGVFGVVSNPYTVRVGINSYLEGYIREENMRFREKEIHFSTIAKSEEKIKTFFTFPPYKKSFEGFSLETEDGEVRIGEIIGILGPNGIGKTTFIKILVGEIKPDEGEPIAGLNLSYKPQRLIVTDEEGYMTVEDYIIQKSNSSLDEVNRLIRFLSLERLLDKNMKNLSGGELQSVFLVSALAREHDILLLDEPSAFLDVEQRLRIAKLIRSHVESNEKACFVVDHDLQLIDSISDRIMVFSGERSVWGFARSPEPMRNGMNRFLRSLGVTFRRDPETGRARANKQDSQKDREQKESGEYYYTG